MHLPKIKIGVLAADPTRRRTGGALLGDRIRMNSLRDSTIFMRSMALGDNINQRALSLKMRLHI